MTTPIRSKVYSLDAINDFGKLHSTSFIISHDLLDEFSSTLSPQPNDMMYSSVIADSIVIRFALAKSSACRVLGRKVWKHSKTSSQLPSSMACSLPQVRKCSWTIIIPKHFTLWSVPLEIWHSHVPHKSYRHVPNSCLCSTGHRIPATDGLYFSQWIVNRRPSTGNLTWTVPASTDCIS